jgi:L-asparagine oxygenase
VDIEAFAHTVEVVQSPVDFDANKWLDDGSFGSWLSHIDSGVASQVAAFSRSRSGEGVLLCKGVDVGVVGRTPSGPRETVFKDNVSERTLLTVASLLGRVVGYAPEHAGDVVQNIVPVKQLATEQSSTSSSVTLAFHTEAAFHPHKPRYLLLLCLRGDPQAATTYALLDDVLPLLPDRARQDLTREEFTTGVDSSYNPRPGAVSKLHSVLSSGSAPVWCWDEELTKGSTPRAREALLDLAMAVGACSKAVVLEEGDLLILDNSSVVHGRSPFSPRFDGTDRWLQRSFVVPDLRAVGDDLSGNVITTSFS